MSSHTTQAQGEVTEFAAHLIKNIAWGSTPEPISWMPATTAWYLVYTAIIFTMLAYVIARYIKWLKASYLREAQVLLETYRHGDTQRIAHLVKRVANQRWPEHQVGTMGCTAFYLFLSEQQGELGLSDECCDAIFNAAYQPTQSVSQRHVEEVKQWIGAIHV